jgi:hypothetical protein
MSGRLLYIMSEKTVTERRLRLTHGIRSLVRMLDVRVWFS